MKKVNSGVYPVMITPYNESGKVNYDSIKKLVRWYAGNGCSGIFAACLSSEIFKLSLVERAGTVAAVREAIDKNRLNLSLVASGHISDDPGQQVEELSAMKEAGADSIVLITNRLDRDKKGDAQWIKEAEELLSRLPSDCGIGFYECPVPEKRLLTEEMFNWMKSTKRVSFIKDTCCDRYLIKKRLELIGDSGIKLFNANEQTYLETLRYGSAGFSGVMANFNPKLFAWIFENYKSNPQKSEEVQEFITAMTFAATLHYPLGVKYILDKYEGIDNCPMSRSLPSETLSDYETMCMEQLWRLDNRFIAALDGK